MRRQDASLVFFTTLAQWSVGITVWLAAWPWLVTGPAVTFATGWTLGNPVLLALVLVGAATTVSFLHLGNPVNAPHAVNNLASSWLSREILALGFYSLALAGLFLARWLVPAGAPAVVMAWLASLAGLALLWTMARVYTAPTIPAWNSAHTPLAFTLTALSLGLLTLILLQAAKGMGVSGTLLFLLLALLVLEAVSGLRNQSRLASMNTGISGPSFTRGSYLRILKFRLALLLPACGLALFLALQAPTGTSAAWLPVLAILVLGQEMAGRVMFYGSYFRLGL